MDMMITSLSRTAESRGTACAGLQHVGRDGLGALGVGHLYVVTGGGKLAGQIAPDGASTDNSKFHDLPFLRA
jgi:hypothetical protein